EHDYGRRKRRARGTAVEAQPAAQEPDLAVAAEVPPPARVGSRRHDADDDLAAASAFSGASEPLRERASVRRDLGGHAELLLQQRAETTELARTASPRHAG